MPGDRQAVEQPLVQGAAKHLRAAMLKLKRVRMLPSRAAGRRVNRTMQRDHRREETRRGTGVESASITSAKGFPSTCSMTMPQRLPNVCTSCAAGAGRPRASAIARVAA
jgi:hypothetical protein